MATKNLVPRQDDEGKLGLPIRRWAGINAVLGSIDRMKTDELLNTQGADLIAAGDNITITKNEDDSPLGPQYIISSTGGGSSEVDRIFEGAEGAQTSVETINTLDPLENKISFAISGNELWNINSQGHFVPRTNTLDLGLSSSPIRDIYLLQDGLNLGSSNLRIDNTSKNLQIGTLVNESLVYEDVTTSLEDVKFATSDPINLITDLVNGLEIDGQSLTTGDRVLVKDQITPSENGIYIVSAAEGPAVRANDLIATSDFSGIRVTVLKGDSNTQKIFFTVPHTDGSSKTATSNMKWLELGGSGLKAVQDDPAPVLGGDLSVGTHTIKTSEITLEMIAKSDSTTDNAKLKFQSTVSGSVLIITSNTNGDTKLSFETQGGKRLSIENVNDNFFTSNSLSTAFKYKFSSTLTTTEKNAGEAFFATQGWVSDQGYLSSADLSSYVTTSALSDYNYIRTADEASLTSLTLGDNYTPSNDKDAATKQYVDMYVQGLREILDPVRAATTDPIDLTIDLINGEILDTTVTLVTGDRILVKNQTTSTENGIYIVAASGAASRSLDFASGDRVASKFVFVEEGTENANSGFICTTPAGTDADPTDEVDTDSITFAKFSAAGQISAGNGISKSGNTISANIDDATIKFDDSNRLKVGEINADQITSGTIDSARLPTNIVANSVDENAIDPDNITTSLGTLADGDLFIVRDVDADPNGDLTPEGQTTKAAASVLRDYIRSDIKTFTGQVDFEDDTLNSTIKSTLRTEAITEQTSYNSSPENDGPLANDDTFLVYDTSSTSLKQVQFSDIKSANSFDIDSFDNLPEGDSVADSDLIVLKDSGSSTHRKVTISEFKTELNIPSKLEYVSVTNTGTIPDIKANTHYHISSSPTSDGVYTFVLQGVAGNPGDIIKITMSPVPFSSQIDNAGNERFHIGRNHIVKVQTTSDESSLITLNKDNFDKPVEFIRNSNGVWQTSILPSNEFSYFSTVTVDELALDDQTNWAKYPSYYIQDSGESLVINIPTSSTIRSWGYKQGHKKTFYFKHRNNKKVTFQSSTSDILLNGLSTLQLFNTISFNLSSSTNIKKITATLLRQSNNENLYWFFEHCIDQVSDVELPAAITATVNDENKVLRFAKNSSNVVELTKGLIQSSNIGDNAIAVDTTSADRIIQDNAIKKSKLEKITPNKVLGYVGSANSNQNVVEVNVLSGDNILDNDITNSHTNLVTATAIKQYVNKIANSITTTNIEGDYITNIATSENYLVIDALPYQDIELPETIYNRFDSVNNIVGSNLIRHYVYLSFKQSDWLNYWKEIDALVDAGVFQGSGSWSPSIKPVYDSLTKFVMPPTTPEVIDILKQRQANEVRTQIVCYYSIESDSITDPITNSKIIPGVDWGFFSHGGYAYDPLYNFKINNYDVSAKDYFKYYGEGENSQIDNDALDDFGNNISLKINQSYEISTIVPNLRGDNEYLNYGLLSSPDLNISLTRLKQSLNHNFWDDDYLTMKYNGGSPIYKTGYGEKSNFYDLKTHINHHHSKTINRINGESKTFYSTGTEVGYYGDFFQSTKYPYWKTSGMYQCGYHALNPVLGKTASFTINPIIRTDATTGKNYVYYVINAPYQPGTHPHRSRTNSQRKPEVSYP